MAKSTCSCDTLKKIRYKNPKLLKLVAVDLSHMEIAGIEVMVTINGGPG